MYKAYENSPNSFKIGEKSPISKEILETELQQNKFIAAAATLILTLLLLLSPLKAFGVTIVLFPLLFVCLYEYQYEETQTFVETLLEIKVGAFYTSASNLGVLLTFKLCGTNIATSVIFGCLIAVLDAVSLYIGVQKHVVDDSDSDRIAGLRAVGASAVKSFLYVLFFDRRSVLGVSLVCCLFVYGMQVILSILVTRMCHLWDRVYGGAVLGVCAALAVLFLLTFEAQVLSVFVFVVAAVVLLVSGVLLLKMARDDNLGAYQSFY